MAVTSRAEQRSRAQSLHRDMVHVMLLATVDAFAMYEAFVASYSVRSAEPSPLAHAMTLERFATLAATLTPLWITLFASAGLYRVGHPRNWVSEFWRTFIAVSCGVMALVVLDYMRRAGAIFPARSIPIYAVFFGTAYVVVGRILTGAAMRLAYAYGFGLRRIVLIGTTPTATRIAVELRRPTRGYRIVGVVSAEHDGGVFANGTPIYRSLESALDAQNSPVDEVLQADDSLGREEVARLVSVANSRGITYRFVPDRYGVFAATSSLTTVDGVPVMRVSLTSLDGWGAVGKRSIDLLGSVLLIVALSPLLVTIALLVKITDPDGPILYRQERVGRGGVPIQVAKFRTMRWAYSTGPSRPYRTPEDAFRAMGREDLLEEFARDHKVANDPRVSALGKFLRRTSLDELPQLLAALRGDLSLIGPRPITRAELERYGPQQASFLALKPGITGLWQVSGRSDVSYDERVKLDIFYIENWSVRLDLSILARTTTAVLTKKGAY